MSLLMGIRLDLLPVNETDLSSLDNCCVSIGLNPLLFQVDFPTIAINRALGRSTLPAAVVSTPSISVRIPISKSVAERTAVDPSTSNFTFVRTGLVDLVGTTTAAV